MKQIVTINTNHICPMVTGITPHVGGPIVGPGNPGVLIDGVPISVLGDTCICCGSPDVVVQGYPGILVDGVPIVVQGCMTAHGGTIPMGVPGVTVGRVTESSVTPTITVSHESPKRNEFLAAISGNSIKEAIANQNKLQKEASEQEPMVYNVRWIREDVCIDTSKECEKVKVIASVIGIVDGEQIDFEITRILESDQSEKMYKLSGIVNNGEVETEIEIEKIEDTEEPLPQMG